MPVVEINYNPLKTGQNVIQPSQNLFIHGAFVNIAIAPIPKDGIQQSVVMPIVGKALIDTGATFTCVDENTCLTLGLNSVGIANMKHVDGTSTRTRYPVQISFPDFNLPPLNLVGAASVVLSNMIPPFVALIGRDLLAHFKLTYNGPRGRIEIAY